MTRNKSKEEHRALYDMVMLLYLVGSLLCLPIVIGEALVQVGLISSIYESDLPKWFLDIISGYEIMMLFTIGTLVFIAWIPALVIGFIFRHSWRVLTPVVLFIAVDIALVLFQGTARTTALNVLGGATVFTAFFIGLEWFIRYYIVREYGFD